MKLNEDFNSHAHVERDTWENLPDTIDEHFNSHAHVERDVRVHKAAAKSYISTHTLTWSVTKTYGQVRSCMHISTHTLTWSVTLSAQSKHAQPCDFNSHAHVERD